MGVWNLLISLRLLPSKFYRKTFIVNEIPTITSTMSSANSLVNKPSLIEWGPLRLLIMDAPKDSNLHLYLKQCKKTNVTSIVRISEPSYSREEVEKSGIALHVRPLTGFQNWHSTHRTNACVYFPSALVLVNRRRCTTPTGTALLPT